jgi:outer membrane biosynthesis protein TonB
MAENKENSKLGSNPLGGGALDWLDDEPAPPAPKPKRKTPPKARPKTPPTKKKASRSKAKPSAKASTKTPAKSSVKATKTEKRRGEATEAQPGEQTDSTRRGVAAGYRRHTLLMREDQIEQLDRLYALDKLHAGSQARSKKDLVEEAFDLFFESERSNPRGMS